MDNALGVLHAAFGGGRLPDGDGENEKGNGRADFETARQDQDPTVDQPMSLCEIAYYTE